jgi:hypothetical protein
LVFDNNINYDLGISPLIMFLRLLISKDIKKSAILNSNLDYLIKLNNQIDTNAEINTNAKVKGDKKYDVPDMIVYFAFPNDNEEKVTMIIENKINARQNKKNNVPQTTRYYKNTFKNKEYPNPIYIFLHVDDDLKELDPHFIVITYKDIFKYILEPCIFQTESENCRKILVDYSKVISRMYSERDEIIMLEQERELLKKIREENNDLYQKLLAADPNVTIDTKQNVREANRKYKYDNQIYNNVGLVRKLIDERIIDSDSEGHLNFFHNYQTTEKRRLLLFEKEIIKDENNDYISKEKQAPYSEREINGIRYYIVKKITKETLQDLIEKLGLQHKIKEID